MIDTFKKYWELILILILVILLLVVNFQLGVMKNRVGNLRAENTILTQSIDTSRNKNGILVAEQIEAEYATSKQLEEKTKKIFDLQKINRKPLKKIKYYGEIVQEVNLDSLFIAYTDTILEYVTDTNYVYVPRQVSTYTDNYEISGRVLKKGIQLDDITIPNTIVYRSIEKKQGLFKQPTTVVQAINTNPYITIKGMNTATVAHKTSAWNKWIKPTLAGIIAAGITYQIVR